MAATRTRPSRSKGALPLDAPTREPIAPRTRALPTSRAIVGGFLVAVAVVSVVVAQRAADRPPTERWVVAAAPLTAGRTLAAEDLRLEVGDLPEGTRGRAFRRATDLVGKVLVANVQNGELIQVSSVASADGARPGEREVSFAVDPTRALGERLRPGDVIDVLATYGQGTDARSQAVVTGVRIIDRQARAGSLGGAPGYIFTVALANPADVTALTTASAAGSLSVVRSTVAEAGGDPLPYAGTPKTTAARATTATTGG